MAKTTPGTAGSVQNAIKGIETNLQRIRGVNERIREGEEEIKANVRKEADRILKLKSNLISALNNAEVYCELIDNINSQTLLLRELKKDPKIVKVASDYVSRNRLIPELINTNHNLQLIALLLNSDTKGSIEILKSFFTRGNCNKYDLEKIKMVGDVIGVNFLEVLISDPVFFPNMYIGYTNYQQIENLSQILAEIPSLMNLEYIKRYYITILDGENKNRILKGAAPIVSIYETIS